MNDTPTGAEREVTLTPVNKIQKLLEKKISSLRQQPQNHHEISGKILSQFYSASDYIYRQY